MLRAVSSRRKTVILVAFIGLLFVTLISGVRKSDAGSYFTPDGTRPKDFTLYKIGNTWHLIGIHEYYNPTPGGQGSPGLVHSTSTDMISWTDHGAAIPVGPAGSWESYDVWAPTLIKDGATYHLWYAGVQTVNNHWVQKIGHATSSDSFTWTKDAGNPVFDCSTIPWVYWNIDDPWGGVECRDPFVTWDAANSQWVMFYTTRMQATPTAPYWLADPPVVGMATSSDLVTWNDAGYHITTAGYAAESPHVFEHNGTWWLVWTSSCTWRGSKCLRYATAPAITGPYTGYNDLPAVGSDEYASEYYRDESGQEYFGRVGSLAGWLDFDELSWPSGNFTLTPTPAGEIRGKVWLDDNRNGLIDTGEIGVGNVTVTLYADNGDEVFDPNTDSAILTAATFGGASTSTLRGTYKIPFLSSYGNEIPWKLMWIKVDPSTFDTTDPVLTDMVSTTPEVIRYDNRTGGINLVNIDFGYNVLDITPPAAVDDLTAL